MTGINYREKRHFFFVASLDRSFVIHQIVRRRISVNTKWRTVEFLDQTRLVV